MLCLIFAGPLAIAAIFSIGATGAYFAFTVPVAMVCSSPSFTIHAYSLSRSGPVHFACFAYFCCLLTLYAGADNSGMYSAASSLVHGGNQAHGRLVAGVYVCNPLYMAYDFADRYHDNLPFSNSSNWVFGRGVRCRDDPYIVLPVRQRRGSERTEYELD